MYLSKRQQSIPGVPIQTYLLQNCQLACLSLKLINQLRSLNAKHMDLATACNESACNESACNETAWETYSSTVLAPGVFVPPILVVGWAYTGSSLPG